MQIQRPKPERLTLGQKRRLRPRRVRRRSRAAVVPRHLPAGAMHTTRGPRPTPTSCTQTQRAAGTIGGGHNTGAATVAVGASNEGVDTSVGRAENEVALDPARDRSKRPVQRVDQADDGDNLARLQTLLVCQAVEGERGQVDQYTRDLADALVRLLQVQHLLGDQQLLLPRLEDPAPEGLQPREHLQRAHVREGLAAEGRP
mmetsp:Transcript_78351/g.203637  ORF Transcript_78351/g.203637 Transcript_78351/m.203637 type:complete len:201 (-) Transcript_78351:167-769(-)